MYGRVAFRCGACSKRLTASLQFVGQSCKCPRCENHVIVPSQLNEDEGSILVHDDGLEEQRPSYY